MGAYVESYPKPEENIKSSAEKSLPGSFAKMIQWK